MIEGIISHDFESDKLSDVAYTLGSGRSNLPIRGYVIATESVTKPQFLSDFHAPAIAKSLMPFSFIFTGQGAQWQGMGLE
jgi:acyl transferase domain-containing protein